MRLEIRLVVFAHDLFYVITTGITSNLPYPILLLSISKYNMCSKSAAAWRNYISEMIPSSYCRTICNAFSLRREFLRASLIPVTNHVGSSGIQIDSGGRQEGSEYSTSWPQILPSTGEAPVRKRRHAYNTDSVNLPPHINISCICT